VGDVETSVNHPRQDDGEMLAGLRAGDRQAWAEMVRTHGSALHRYLVGLGVKSCEAEDLVQEVFLRAWRTLRDRGEGPAADFGIRPWLLVIGRHLCVDVARRKRVHGSAERNDFDRMIAPAASAEKHLEDLEEAEATRAAVEGLPERLRQPLLLKLHGGLSYSEISRILGVPPGTVGSRLHDALECLRKVLKREAAR
jgi:RNA polymerase sigma-70 factor (ECF subfamily)